ncbi:MAG TPA: hypothetical protein VFV87_10260, partial [Pirellulaceae bacterium]|nr:hypothetical protein [Pirellulaceae bacterium]
AFAKGQADKPEKQDAASARDDAAGSRPAVQSRPSTPAAPASEPAASAPPAPAPAAQSPTSPLADSESDQNEKPAEAIAGKGNARGVPLNQPQSAARPTAKDSLGDGQETQEKLAELKAKGAVAAAPPSIYFNPKLIADENGRATIEFTLPPVESEYRLLIDALGNGRIGSLQQVIEVKSAK